MLAYLEGSARRKTSMTTGGRRARRTPLTQDPIVLAAKKPSTGGRLLLLLATALFVLQLDAADAFLEPFLVVCRGDALLSTRVRRVQALRHHTALRLKDEWFAYDDSGDEDDDEAMVTREMLFRDMLGDPKVRKKGKGKGKAGYRPMDNRDHLPFVVKQVTPDPYTHPEKKVAKAKRTRSKRTDLDRQLTPSKLYEKAGDASTLLGEFKLDKSTTSGDVIVIGNYEFEVQKARCQYKYVGGQRFAMVRKILEVKEVTRAAREELIAKQFHESDEHFDQPPKLS